jgi:hypothetical protein
VAFQLATHRGFDANEQNAHAKLAGSKNRTFDFDARRMVAPHGIQGNSGHLGTGLIRQARES